MRGLFVTGTDTDAGKTVVSLGLMQHLQDQGLAVAGFKPVASGSARTPDGLRNDDALQLQRQSSIELPYELVNPYTFEPAIAPHVAAAEAGVVIERAVIAARYAEIAARVDVVLVEGAGGWRVPLGGALEMADLAQLPGVEVCLVVGMRLGCLNHALLSEQAIRQAGAPLAGWVANCLPPSMARLEENINTLKAQLTSPLLGVVPPMDPVCVKTMAINLDYACIT